VLFLISFTQTYNVPNLYEFLTKQLMGPIDFHSIFAVYQLFGYLFS